MDQKIGKILEENNFDRNSLQGSQTLFYVEMTCLQRSCGRWPEGQVQVYTGFGLECSRPFAVDCCKEEPRELTEYREGDRIHPRS